MAGSALVINHIAIVNVIVVGVHRRRKIWLGFSGCSLLLVLVTSNPKPARPPDRHLLLNPVVTFQAC
ncbi:hypothetical protein MYCTH_2295338 [Thermothelomyces thermophilus ATCC 42464]|uniref:Uncharacterized protein n=1 Tax=Thermothelomyces thermophilus (strain ATCC 42464 / BCRC 31852 / DSM 1799) TaxID=573729 RepID=G2Q4I3_THET4|nr:uncharacterized protein MYCTH_2295338 [Thermothelomyces thermophilus ATCC 42464]AEO53676.1 hypothetical protein MYCTH_2295338 [Thermothelomyces thermophilus ATCC 42464]